MTILRRVLQAKIELSAMWLRAQTEGTVLLIGQEPRFGRRAGAKSALTQPIVEQAMTEFGEMCFLSAQIRSIIAAMR